MLMYSIVCSRPILFIIFPQVKNKPYELTGKYVFILENSAVANTYIFYTLEFLLTVCKYCKYSYWICMYFYTNEMLTPCGGGGVYLRNL